MAARLNPKHDQRTRDKIKTSQLLNRLMLHANGECEMKPSQIRAAEILLKKVLPDMQAIQHSGDAENPVGVVVLPEKDATTLEPDAEAGAGTKADGV